MKTGVSAGLLLLGIVLILFSYVWERMVQSPLTDEEIQLMAESDMSVTNREFNQTSATPDDAKIKEATRIAEEGKAKVKAYHQKVNFGKFVFRLCGIMAALVGGGLYLWTRSQEE